MAVSRRSKCSLPRAGGEEEVALRPARQAAAGGDQNLPRPRAVDAQMVESRRRMRGVEDQIRYVSARVDQDHVEAMRQHPYEVVVAAVESRPEVAECDAQERPLRVSLAGRSDQAPGAEVGQAFEHVALEVFTAVG